jgi:hypothetical protein
LLRCKPYRFNYLSFIRAFVGLLIALVGSTVYVIVLVIDYYMFIPDFMERYTDHVLTQAKTSGASPAEMVKKTSEMKLYTDMYKNPLFVILLTYAEIFPIGLVVSLIAALILKRKTISAHTEV